MRRTKHQPKENFSKKLLQIWEKAEPFVPYLAAVIIGLHLLIAVIIPFVFYNSLFTNDMSGHYYSGWYVHNYLFPRATGWDPNFFFGFAQNQFYEPLFSYLAALFAFVIPFDAAFRIIVLAIVILTPIGGYVAARSLAFSKPASAAIVLGIYSGLLVLESFVGGGLMSTFSTGLIPNALGLMLFLFFIAALTKTFQNNRFAVLSGVLLGTIILSHLMASIAAIILLLAFTITSKKPGKIKSALLILLIGFLISAWWIIPAATNASFINSFSVSNPYNWILLIVTIIGFLIYQKIKTRLTSVTPLWVFLLILSAGLFLGEAVFNARMHYARFNIYFFIIAPFCFLAYSRKAQPIFIICAFIVCLSAIFISPFNIGEGTYEKTLAPINEKIDGRILVLTLPWQSTSPHEFQQLIPFMNNTSGSRGVYQESSYNAKLLFSLEDALQPQNITKENSKPLQGLYLPEYSPLLRKELALFNINYVVSTQQIDSQWIPIQKLAVLYFLNSATHRLEKNVYWLYKTAPSSFADVLPYTPKKVSLAGWNEYALAWFYAGGNEDNITTTAELQAAQATGMEKVTVIEQSPTSEYMKLFVDSNKDVPVYIKMSYFPKWHAYSNGVEIPVYRATPFFMLVNGHGIIELKYEPELSEIMGAILTIIGAIISFVLLIKIIPHKSKHIP